MRKSIVIAVPSFGKVSLRWAFNFRALATPMNSICPCICEQGFEVGTARNRIVQIALGLSSKPSHIFWLDDDVICHPYAILELLDDKKDIVSGCYFTKGDFPEAIIYGEEFSNTLPYYPDIGTFKVWASGGGLSLVKLDVYRKMAKQLDLGTDEKGNPRWYYTSGDKPDEKYRANEDMWFVRKAHEAGFQPYLNTSSQAFGWHFDLEGDIGHPKKQWKQYLEKSTADWEIPDWILAELKAGRRFDVHPDTLKPRRRKKAS